jgi:DNA mismatch endonuclease (patch repair protein)
MSDVLTPEQRHHNMARIKSRDTKPEIIVRSMVHLYGRRFRLYDSSLPGKPDIVLRKDKKVIFIHGCFWHLHHCRFGRVVPKTNAEFWKNKRLANKVRDKKNIGALKKAGWKVLILWECQIRKMKIKKSLEGFLNPEI